jgi:cysteine synthase A
VDLIGWTPLLHLKHIAPPTGAEIYGKLEYLSPGASIKDRAALGMILAAEREGKLQPGSTIIEPTAGNTGIGLALVGVTRGYRIILVVPEGYSVEKLKVMQALGGELVLTPHDAGMAFAIRKAFELASQIENSYVPQQFANPANPNFHEQTTGREILEQLDAPVHAVAIGCGTAGTFTGVARAVKKRFPHAYCVAVESEGSVLGGGPPGPHRVEGIGTSFIPENFDPSVCDEVMMVKDDDAFAMVKRLAREEAVLTGGSGGANAFAALELSARLGPGMNVVTLFPDSAERYTSKGIFD